MIADPIDLDLFAGPGGWDEGCQLLDLGGVTFVGVEWDGHACSTRGAAGHLTIRADVGAYPTEPFVGRVRGLIASPPCQMFSNAGTGAGRLAVETFANCMTDLMHGLDTRRVAIEIAYGLSLPGARRAVIDMERTRLKQGKQRRPLAELRAASRSRARTQAENAVLVCEPARWAHDVEPEWIALEQVPGVQPLWDHLADLLRARGYSVWTGKLNAANYGVPQTRERAILVASRVRVVQGPPATHDRAPVPSLFDGEPLPWVSMARALGWGLPRRPSLTIAPGNMDTWLSGGSSSREVYERAEAEGDWVVRTGASQATTGPGDRDGDWHDRTKPYERSLDEPSPTLDRKAGGAWVVLSNYSNNGRPGTKSARSADEPAATVTSKTGNVRAIPGELPPGVFMVNTGRDWKEGGTREDAQTFDAASQPAPTIDGKGRWHVRVSPEDGGRGKSRTFDPFDRPSRTITGMDLAKGWWLEWVGDGEPEPLDEQRVLELLAAVGVEIPSEPAAEWLERRNDQTGASETDPNWPLDRPATTVAGRGLVPDPGTTSNRFNDAAKSRNDGVRIELTDALVLQSFRPDYPVAGPKGDQFRQVGDAVPPLLAAHVVAEASGCAPPEPVDVGPWHAGWLASREGSPLAVAL